MLFNSASSNFLSLDIKKFASSSSTYEVSNVEDRKPATLLQILYATVVDFLFLTTLLFV